LLNTGICWLEKQIAKLEKAEDSSHTRSELARLRKKKEMLVTKGKKFLGK
jgi:hypothetical protein